MPFSCHNLLVSFLGICDLGICGDRLLYDWHFRHWILSTQQSFLQSTMPCSHLLQY